MPAALRARVSGELSDSVQLIALAGGQTRLLWRMRAARPPVAFRWLALSIVRIWGERITARHFLRGLKRRAERARGNPSGP